FSCGRARSRPYSNWMGQCSLGVLPFRLYLHIQFHPTKSVLRDPWSHLDTSGGGTFLFVMAGNICVGRLPASPRVTIYYNFGLFPKSVLSPCASPDVPNRHILP